MCMLLCIHGLQCVLCVVNLMTCDWIIIICSSKEDWSETSLIPRPRPQGGKGSGTHRALSGAHRMQHIMWFAWQCIVLAWQRINRSHTLQYTAIEKCHMIIICRPRGVTLIGVLEFLTKTHHQAPKSAHCVPDPFPSWGRGLGMRLEWNLT